jgi:hypothetical protein
LLATEGQPFPNAELTPFVAAMYDAREIAT